MNRNELEGKIVRKAWEDESFKQRLKDNPKDAIEEVLKEEGSDESIPENHAIHVHEETPTTSHLVIPTRPGTPDPDLETVHAMHKTHKGDPCSTHQSPPC